MGAALRNAQSSRTVAHHRKNPSLTSFHDFGLAEPITRALAQENYVTPTPIQIQTIPVALSRRDVVGIAQTGTGKTAAFALPILHRLFAERRRPERKTCRVLVLSPTRELSGQIRDSFHTYGRHLGVSAALAIGGVPLGAPVRSPLNRVIRVDRAGKPAALVDILRREPIDRALVFTRTKHGADKVVRGLVKAGVAAEAIHGNKSQNRRESVLAAFRKGEVRTLVATDIAARGIDVDGISHVVNFDLPNVPETYVHRIGRTARAGAEGIAISLCDAEETAFLRGIERLIRMSIPATDQRSVPHQA